MSIPFPPLFACACAKDWSVEQGRGCWNPIGIRLFNDWELEHVKRLLSLLRGKKVIEELGGGGGGGGGGGVKGRTENGVFSIKSMYKVL